MKWLKYEKDPVLMFRLFLKGMGLDNRMGRFLNAGIGYGGSCFPKDVAALNKTSTDQAYDFKLLREV